MTQRQRRKKAANSLRNWADTFEDNRDEDGNIDLSVFNHIHILADKLEANTCDEKDIKEIAFHIAQMKGFTLNI